MAELPQTEKAKERFKRPPYTVGNYLKDKGYRLDEKL